MTGLKKSSYLQLQVVKSGKHFSKETPETEEYKKIISIIQATHSGRRELACASGVCQPAARCSCSGSLFRQ